MLNVVAAQILLAMLHGPLMDTPGVTAGTYLPQSEQLPEAVWLPKLVPQTLMHTGVIVAVVLAFVVYIFLWRTTIGYRIRAVGLNPDASRYAGIRVPVYQALALTLAGGLAGLAGVVEVIGVQHRSAGWHHQRLRFQRYRRGPVRQICIRWARFRLRICSARCWWARIKCSAPCRCRLRSSNVLLGLVVLFVVGSQYYARRRAATRAATAAPAAPAAPVEEAASA